MGKRFSPYFLLLFFACLYLLPIQGHSLFIPDETRYAEIPREMLASGDWVVPVLNGLRYFEKPVMGYWLSAVSLSVFGENNFSVRLPSALSVGFTALFIYFLLVSFYRRDDRVPLLASFIYLTTAFVAGTGSLAILDTPLTFFLTATMVMFFMATEERVGSSKERSFLLAAGMFAGCAFLTKGFLAFAVPVIVIGPYLFLQRRWLDTLRMLFLPVLGAILVSLPWAILIHQREPDFWNYFFWYEHVHRFLAETAQHSEPFHFFFLALPVMFMPWTMLLPAAIAGSWHKTRPGGAKGRLLLYCFCWFLFPFLFFSASNGKLLTYILPCIPPLVILFTFGMVQWIDTSNRRRNFLQWAIVILMGLISCTFVYICGIHLFGPEQLRIFEQSEKWLLLGAGLLAVFIGLGIAYRNKQKLQKIILFGASFAILFFCIQFIIPAQTLNKKSPGPFLSRHAAAIPSDTYVLSGQDVVRAVCWYLKRDDVYLVFNGGELTYGLKYDEKSRRRLLSVADTTAFIAQHRGHVVLLVHSGAYRHLQSSLPAPVKTDISGKDGYFLLHY